MLTGHTILINQSLTVPLSNYYTILNIDLWTWTLAPSLHQMIGELQVALSRGHHPNCCMQFKNDSCIARVRIYGAGVKRIPVHQGWRGRWNNRRLPLVLLSFGARTVPGSTSTSLCLMFYIAW